MAGTSQVLSITAGMPERQLEAGEVLYGQGDGSPTEVAVLVSGALRIELGGVEFDNVTLPGAFVGEIGALLGTARTATVVAVGPATVRVIGDPERFFETHPPIALELARQLAGRLHRLVAYLGDVRVQFADASGHLAMIDSILGRLATRPPVEIDPGSDRSPDY